MKVTLILFYLLILLLPTQLGRHFFFNFSLLSGLRSDYLAPTIFLSDIIIFLIFILQIHENLKKKVKNNFSVGKLFFLILIIYLLFNSVFIASNQLAALYKTLKIFELSVLSFVILKIKPKISTVIPLFSIDVFYTSIISIMQFIYQRSLGGIFWFLGERNFNAATPGIAAFSWFGQLYLRPYSIFPHPNVMGGFLAVTLPLLFWFYLNNKHKNALDTSWFIVCQILGISGLIISFSRLSWFVGIVGYLLIILIRKKIFVQLLKMREKILLSGFYVIVFLSSVFPLFIPRELVKGHQSWDERYNLLKTTITMIASYPIFGVGLNNSIVHAISYAPKWDLYYFQPVHNIYMLVFSETGLIGFFIFLISLIFIYRATLVQNKLILIPLTQMFILGLFDHYLFTLQQGMLLFTVFASLAFLRENK